MKTFSQVVLSRIVDFHRLQGLDFDPPRSSFGEMSGGSFSWVSVGYRTNPSQILCLISDDLYVKINKFEESSEVWQWFLAPDVQKVDTVIQWINFCPVRDNAIGIPNRYPLDSDLSGW